jgi:hypothetical protein
VSLQPLRAAVATWKPGLGVASDPLHAIVTAWPAIVGAHVAAHCAPIEFAPPVLVIATRSSAWSQQLHFLSGTILAGVRALPLGAQVTRLTFRSGRWRKSAERRAASVPASRNVALRGAPAASLPAADAAEALGRLRERFALRRRARGEAACEHCGTGLGESPLGSACAPCAGKDAAERILAAERLLYLCPWFEPDAVREQVPGLAAGEVERIRRRLLQRWWLVLERARRAGRLSRSGLERSIASSYVLLQSRLPPDRITPAVVRNLLGPELERLLWPSVAP